MKLNFLLDEVESSEKEADQASENEPDDKIHISHDSKGNFEYNDEYYEISDSKENIF